MVCWTIPLAAAVITYGMRKIGGFRDAQSFWLNLMFFGGALFGIVDHLWFGELFLISEAWAMDLLLGGTISAVITGSWGIIVSLSRTTSVRRPSIERRAVIE